LPIALYAVGRQTKASAAFESLVPESDTGAHWIAMNVRPTGAIALVRFSGRLAKMREVLFDWGSASRPILRDTLQPSETPPVTPRQTLCPHAYMAAEPLLYAAMAAPNAIDQISDHAEAATHRR
jgi:hypothetical protein